MIETKSSNFFEQPILNSPYQRPERHWELKDGQPTGHVIEKRRPADLITPVPKPRKRKQKSEDVQQGELDMYSSDGISSEQQHYDPTSLINEIRNEVERWRSLPCPEDWQVTPETARLLQHWRHHDFHSFRPFEKPESDRIAVKVINHLGDEVMKVFRVE